MAGVHIPIPSPGASGVKPDGTATATCLCGAVQLSFPVEGEDLVNTFVCNCTDCRKLSSSMFCSNFTVKDRSLKHLRGEEKLSRYAQNRTIASGAFMEDSFCSICGNLMYRRSTRFPGLSILRIGTVDDFNLHESKLKPQFEQFTEDRVGWFDGVQIEGIPRHDKSRI
ncbi:Mss4-like protein [Talaromyces proteolyticus]|uniref:Mss4-like protein n=1 Tax=Talaromyces proteolyticus TaxID=1131652 RepID=A0AAD4L447_9EURO|nr:Mss4-like protein [Talaromyces proteolyticus]KAH8703212.1 Mss4-like protein [Talaromyces proteolyticus]